VVRGCLASRRVWLLPLAATPIEAGARLVKVREGSESLLRAGSRQFFAREECGQADV